MIKIGVADYGMNVWYGGLYDYEQRLDDLKKIGYDGTERISPLSAEEAMYKASALRRRGMDFATCLCTSIENSIRWTAAMGKKYVWIKVSESQDFDKYTRQVNDLCEFAGRFGITVALHNHMGSLVETQEQLDTFMKVCPKAGLLLDVGHLAVAGGDPLGTAKKYYDRIVALHLKEWFMTNPEAENWGDRGRFCEFGGGNIPVDNEGVVKYVISQGYDKWVFIEQDTHLQDPLTDLKHNREILRSWGA